MGKPDAGKLCGGFRFGTSLQRSRGYRRQSIAPVTQGVKREMILIAEIELRWLQGDEALIKRRNCCPGNANRQVAVPR